MTEHAPWWNLSANPPKYAGSDSEGVWDHLQGNAYALGKPCAYRAVLDGVSLKLSLGRTIYLVFGDKKAVSNITPWKGSGCTKAF